jgi:hypothetical protein
LLSDEPYYSRLLKSEAWRGSLLLIKQLIHYLLAIAEIRALDPLEGVGQIKQSASRRQVQLEAYRSRESLACVLLFALIDAFQLSDVFQFSIEGSVRKGVQF